MEGFLNLYGLLTTMGHQQAYTLITFGLLLLAGFAAHVLGRRVHVPRVTLLLLLGFLAGPSALELLPAEVSRWFPLTARAALSIIGFQLGEQFLGKNLRSSGQDVLIISLAVVSFTLLFVGGLLVVVHVPLVITLLLAGVALATAPAATVDLIREVDASGPVTEHTLGVVAIDDVWGVILFSLLIVSAQVVNGQEASLSVILEGIWEVAGGILLGVLLGLPMAWMTGRIRPGELTRIETMGFVFLCGGLAMRYDLSYLLACMAMGATVTNLAKHHERPFHAIEEVEQPFLIIFFLLAGYQFKLAAFNSMGIAGMAYVIGRTLGRLAGGYLGGRLSRAPIPVSTHIGWCLLPQAGVALGLGLIAAERFPKVGPHVLSVIIGTTVVFEILGPIAARVALKHAGEIVSDVSSGD